MIATSMEVEVVLEDIEGREVLDEKAVWRMDAGMKLGDPCWR